MTDNCGLFWLCLLLLMTPFIAAEGLSVLNLEKALSFAHQDHPDVLLQKARQQQAKAEYENLDAENLGARARLILDGRWVEPGDSSDSRQFTGSISHNDSRAHFIIDKTLYDFGATRASLAAKEAEVHVEEQNLALLYQQRRISIARAFFNVLLADLEFAFADESMAIEFVRLDRLKDRNRLGQLSDIALARQENSYQSQRIIRYQAEANQRIMRAQLAEIMSQPDELPVDLLKPDLQLDRDIPEYDVLVEQAMTANPLLTVLQADMQASTLQLKAARSSARPVIRGELRASEYNREFITRDRYRAGLLLEIPLYTGGRTGSKRKQAQAGFLETEALLAMQKIEIRQALREAVERLLILRVTREQAIAEQDFRDLDLDRARTEYELEFVSDLGNAMADSTGARFKREKAEYELALTWAEIALLTGHPEWEIFQAERQ
ncbi:MAG: TolC family protein [Gammaproteobacteria bacterium]